MPDVYDLIYFYDQAYFFLTVKYRLLCLATMGRVLSRNMKNSIINVSYILQNHNFA